MNARTLWAELKPDAHGLVPAVCVDAATGGVLMVAWLNEEALTRTLAGGRAVFYSRSRGRLWEKGETSGHTLAVREVRFDCDADCLLFVCDPAGPACHTGRPSCFFRRVADEGMVEDAGPAGGILGALERVIVSRQTDGSARSYTRSLLEAGWTRVLAKLREESQELASALPAGDRAHTAHEAADLLVHVLVALRAADVSLGDVLAELTRRFGVSGIDEKERRGHQA
jgi:phosphoribosyl-ATP pyrophosphohydrolase/phosphoribosyl-AMP cyclohydrolase